MLLGNTRCSARPDKGCLTYRGGRARLVHHIKCGGWASPPAEDSRTIPRPRDTWRFRTPTWCGRPDGRRRSRTPMGVRASAVGTELPFFRDTWRLRTLPQAGSGSGAVGLVREEPDRWGLATPPFPRSYGQLRESCLAAVRVGIPVTGYRHPSSLSFIHCSCADRSWSSGFLTRPTFPS